MGETEENGYGNVVIPNRILIVCDATKDRNEYEFIHTIRNIRMFGGIVNPWDTITVFGVLNKFLHPLGYQMRVAPDFLGTTQVRAMNEQVKKKLNLYTGMLEHSAEECEDQGIDIEVKIVAGDPIKKVVIQEVANCNPTWVIVDRHLRKELCYYLANITCKIALINDSLSLAIHRPPHPVNKQSDNAIENKLFDSLSKPVPLLPIHNEMEQSSPASLSYNASVVSLESSDMTRSSSMLSSFTPSSKEQNFFSQDELGSNPKQNDSDNYSTGLTKYLAHSSVITKKRRNSSRKSSSDMPLLCISCGLTTELDSMKYSYSEIQLATNNFSSDNLLGEGGYGLVYKGALKNGQQIAAKVRKEESTQGFKEFHSEVYVLTFARHKNIVMLLGYSCKENLNILVYEYICNKSLEWHLFDNDNHVLEWHRRHAVAIGTAKGLRFLHEECRGSPIIHRDMRPSNILLTHDFVPMLGDFGLAKWKTTEEDVSTRILGTLGYLAPEYAEDGIVSVRTDVYAFGIVLIQLISGRRVVDSAETKQQSLRQWASPLIEKLALHEVADPRLVDYNISELYHMAKTAYLCVQTNPEMRPSMAEVLRLLEGENDNFQHLTEQFIPHYSR